MAKSRRSVNWGEYFHKIRQECPWSYAAWLKGQIDIVEWAGQVIPLQDFQARIYAVASNEEAEKLAAELDHGADEWLFSHPEYGEFGTPVPVLIQQDRDRLAQLRSKLNEAEHG